MSTVLIIDYIRRDKVVYAIVKKSAVDINFYRPALLRCLELVLLLIKDKKCIVRRHYVQC